MKEKEDTDVFAGHNGCDPSDKAVRRKPTGMF